MTAPPPLTEDWEAWRSEMTKIGIKEWQKKKVSDNSITIGSKIGNATQLRAEGCVRTLMMRTKLFRNAFG